MTYNPLYGNFPNRYFYDIFPSVEEFIAKQPEPLKVLTNDELTTLYYLLYARYGNDTIASYDENQFIYKVFSTIYMYGPTWAKRIEVQNKIRGLTDDELMTGSKNILNTALNPGGTGTTADLTELNYINQQNTSNVKRGKLEAYTILWDILKTDVTEDFINKFKKLFIYILQPDYPLWYKTDEENEV